MLGGFIFNIANVLLIAGIEIVGLAVAYPIFIGIALIEGVVLSYAIQPRGSALLLGAGVLMAVVPSSWRASPTPRCARRPRASPEKESWSA